MQAQLLNLNCCHTVKELQESITVLFNSSTPKYSLLTHPRLQIILPYNKKFYLLNKRETMGFRRYFQNITQNALTISLFSGNTLEILVFDS